MAACSVGGATIIKLFRFQSDQKKIRSNGGVAMSFKAKCGLRGFPTRLIISGFNKHTWTPTNLLVAGCSSVGTTTDDDNLEDNYCIEYQSLPGSREVQSLLTTICDTTSIAEFELKLAGFRVYVKRNLVEKSIPQPVPTPPVIQSNSSNKAPDSNGFATSTSLALSKRKPSWQGIQSINTASDEGLVVLKSPRVGFFKESRTIKGKRAPSSCKENQEVKAGQVLCYVEQFGGEVPVESDVAGEVIKILRRDGEPVGYGDPLVVILPSFPGIKRLQ